LKRHGRDRGADTIRKHLSYANITATLALLIAIAGGTAYAVDKINSRDIANNSIRSADLKNHKGVRGKDIKPNSLTGRQIDESTLRTGSIARLAGNETGTECLLQVAQRTCVATSITVSVRSELMVVATGSQESLGNGPGQAVCRVAVDGHEESLSIAPGEAKMDNTNINATNGFARTLLTKSLLDTGQHTVALRCQRLGGQVRIDDPTIAAIAIAAH
jgi:hypothetical protein